MGPTLRALALTLSALLLPGSALAATGELQAASPALQASPTDTPIAVAAHLDHTATNVTITFDLSRPVSVTSAVLEGPDRILIEASDINFQVSPEVGRSVAGPLVRSFRFGHFAAGKSRIVVDLAGPARVQKLDVAPIAGGAPSRLVIQIAKCDRNAFHQAAISSASIASKPPPVDRPVPDADPRPVVVVDPGHGGVDPGAEGVGGIAEKKITFDFASALADKLRASGRYRVVMTRDGDTFVSLADRVKVARDAKAALFISVHADTLRNAADVSGATIYTASDKASDAEAARVAEAENRADEAAGVSETPDASDVNDILFDLTRRETRTFSHAFQHTLLDYWRKIARVNRNPERAAGFKVLQAPDIPSVLLELGYLSSEKDVAALTSADWRDRAVGSVAASVDTFFATRLPSEQVSGVVSELRTGDPDRTAVVVLRPHL